MCCVLHPCDKELAAQVQIYYEELKVALANAEKLIARAQTGEKLPRRERLHCIGYIMATMPTLTNREIGEIFGITERAVRQDKQKVKEERASQIKEEDIALVIADIAMTYDVQIRDIERSKQKCKMGGKDYLTHCKTIFDMQRLKVEALQNLGYYPKNLGNMTVEKFEYKAIVNSDSSVVTARKIDVIDTTPKSIESPIHRDLDVLDAEFSDIQSDLKLDEQASDSKRIQEITDSLK